MIWVTYFRINTMVTVTIAPEVTTYEENDFQSFVTEASFLFRLSYVLLLIVNDFGGNSDVQDGHHGQNSNDVFVLLIAKLTKQ